MNWPRRVRSAVLHAVSMANAAFVAARANGEHHFDARVRLQAEVERLEREASLLREELRIKDARMERVPAQRRPHCPPAERLAILELRAARAWSLAETARRMLVTLLTVASWNQRLDDEGAGALVRLSEPVNRFPEFVGYLVRRLRVLCPTMGTERIASVLARAGLHLGATTVRRMLAARPTPAPVNDATATGRTVTARRPNHVWHVDLTTVSTSRGFWIPWSPFALPQRWPFCWWVAVAIDHFSRRTIAVAVFRKQPAARDVVTFLDRAVRDVGSAPGHLVTDHGKQFTARALSRWCRRRKVEQRFGALGKYGSLAVVERFIRSFRTECARQIAASMRRDVPEQEFERYRTWYNADRPHAALSGATPDEIYRGRRPAARSPRFEPRARWPRSSPCARPYALVRGRPGVRVELYVEFRDGRAHLPVVTLQRVAQI